MLSSLEFAIQQSSPKYKHVLEFGVYKGRTLNVLRSQFDKSYQVFGFDSFVGLPENWEGTCCSKGAFTTNGKIPDIDGVRIYAGWFDETLPEYLKEGQPVSLLHLDCDLYSATKTVLESIDHLLLKDTVICCDEWLYRSTDGKLKSDHEQRAVLEWSSSSGKKIHQYDFVDKTVNGFERKVLRIL